MINFCSVNYNRLYGIYNCDCGKTHEFNVKCLLTQGAFKQSAAFLSNFTPFLSRIVLLYDDEDLMLRFYNGVKKDYRVTYIKADGRKKQTELISLPEDTKLIVAIGSENAISGAKYKAQLCDLPVVIAALPTFCALSSYCIINDGGACVTYAVNKPVGYIFDLEIPLKAKHKAALFGQIAARLNSAFEYYASALLSGTEYCPFIAGGMSDIAAKTILNLKEVNKNSPVLPVILLENSLKLALIASTSDVIRGGEMQCSLSYYMLNGNGYLQGELQFIFAAVLAQLYKSHICRRRSFTPPPDNNYRLELISELFGISEYSALRFLRPQLSGKQAAIIEYKIKEYSTDLTQKLSAEINLFKLAFKIFKRLYDDDGYSLSTFKNADISLCIALAADVIRGEGMLTALKRLGELDCYIV